MKTWGTINRVLLGLLMLIPGLAKLFIMGPSAVSGFLSGIALLSWAPLFWTWVLIIFEIGTGLAILANWKLEYTTIPPMIILLVAALTVYVDWTNLANTNLPNVLLHLVAISNYILLGCYGCKK